MAEKIENKFEEEKTQVVLGIGSQPYMAVFRNNK